MIPPKPSWLAVVLCLGGQLTACYGRGAESPLKGRAATVSLSEAAAIELGARLFTDTVLSQDSSISCATCHKPERAFTESLTVSHGIGNRARKRNTPTLLDVSVGLRSFDWDGRARDLREQLVGVFSRDGDMGIDAVEAVGRISSDDCYASLFNRAFGAKASVASFFQALVEFQESLISGQSRFDRFYLAGDSGALSQQEQEGWDLFRSPRTGCSGCHSTLPDPESGKIVFSSENFRNLGIGFDPGGFDDVGRFGVTRNPKDWGAFRVPALRNVSITGPYMHDGSIQTLEAVVELYSLGGISNPNLDPVAGSRRAFSSKERDAIVAFLRALTSEASVTSTKSGQAFNLSSGSDEACQLR